jgi:hypothetical protein
MPHPALPKRMWMEMWLTMMFGYVISVMLNLAARHYVLGMWIAAWLEMWQQSAPAVDARVIMLHPVFPKRMRMEMWLTMMFGYVKGVVLNLAPRHFALNTKIDVSAQAQDIIEVKVEDEEIGVEAGTRASRDRRSSVCGGGGGSRGISSTEWNWCQVYWNLVK